MKQWPNRERNISDNQISNEMSSLQTTTTEDTQR